MNEVEQGLFVGSLEDSFDQRKMIDNQIDTVINVAEEVCLLDRPGLEYHKFDIPDDSDQGDIASILPECLELIHKCILDKRRVLVHCLEGKSRSVCVVLAYMLIYVKDNVSFYEVLRKLKAKRPIVDIFPLYLAQTKAYYDSYMLGERLEVERR